MPSCGIAPSRCVNIFKFAKYCQIAICNKMVVLVYIHTNILGESTVLYILPTFLLSGLFQFFLIYWAWNGIKILFKILSLCLLMRFSIFNVIFIKLSLNYLHTCFYLFSSGLVLFFLLIHNNSSIYFKK